MPIEIRCLNCGSLFKIPPSREGRRKFCKMACRAQYLRDHPETAHTPKNESVFPFNEMKSLHAEGLTNSEMAIRMNTSRDAISHHLRDIGLEENRSARVPPKVLPIEPAELGWLAGLFEGEGSICISKSSKSRSFTLYVNVQNTERELVEPFMIFGGKVYERKKYSGSPWKKCYCWQVNGQEAYSVVTHLSPYLKSKRKSRLVVIALEFMRTMNGLGQRPTTEQLDARERIWAEAKALNRRGRKLLAAV